MKKHFFDVGANVGQTFDDYLNKVSTFDGWDVWCFEPSPRHLQQLMTTAAQNAHRYNIHVCPVGVMGTSKLMPFFMKDDPRGDSFYSYLASDHMTMNLKTGFALHIFGAGIVDLFHAVTEENDEVVLKLDCEGGEYAILERLLDVPFMLKRVKKIFVEFHSICEGGNAEQQNRIVSLLIARGVIVERWMY